MSEQVNRYALLHGTLEFADALCPVYLPRWVRAVDYDALEQRCRGLEADAERAGAVFLNKNAECIALRAEVEMLRGLLAGGDKP